MLKRRLFGMFTPAPMTAADGAGGGAGGQGSAAGTGNTAAPAGKDGESGTPGNGAAEARSGNADFEKLLNIVEGRMKASEESVLKGFYKEQGLSQEEAQQAIAAFKAEKAKNQPDAGELRKEAENAKETARRAVAESRAVLLAVELGIEAKSIPYVLKLADMSRASRADGSIDDEAVKAALEKVLADVPAFKGPAAPAAPAKPEYNPKNGAASVTSRAAAIAAARKNAVQTDNPYANSWGTQK